MKFKALFAISILVLLFTACQPALRLVFGIKKPQIENPDTMMKFTNEVGIGEENVFTVDTLGYQMFGKYLNTSGFHYFDPNGKIMVKPAGCAPADSDYLEQLITSHENKDIFQEDAAYDFELISEYFRDLKGEKATIANDTSSYKAVFVWANYMGKGRVERSLVGVEEIKNSKYPFKVYYLNIDVQEFWGLEEAPPMKIEIGK